MGTVTIDSDPRTRLPAYRFRIARLWLIQEPSRSTLAQLGLILVGQSHERRVAGHGVSQAHVFQLG